MKSAYVALSMSGSSTGRRRGNRSTASSTRARTSGSASSVQATPTSSSSSDSSGCGSNPGASTPSSSSQPATSAAIGPAVSKLAASGQQPSSETRPWVGLCPTIPQQAAGIRIEPAESVPSASSTSAGRDRRRRAAARSSRHAARRDRVRHVAVMRVLGGRPVRELVQVRLAGDRVAGVLEQAHGRRGRRGHVAGEDRRAVRRLEPGRVEEILDRDRDPGRRGLGPGEEDAQSNAR